jgi:hypothetical protein
MRLEAVLYEDALHEGAFEEDILVLDSLSIMQCQGGVEQQIAICNGGPNAPLQPATIERENGRSGIPGLRKLRGNRQIPPCCPFF